MLSIAFYLAMSAACLWCAAFLHERDRHHAKQIAMALTMACCISNSTWVALNWWMWPMLDAAIAWFVAVRYRRRPTVWKLILVRIAALQMAAHVIWQTGDKSVAMAYGYTAALNGLFLAQLSCVAFSGSKGFDDVRSGCFARLYRFRDWCVHVLQRRSD